MQVVCRDGSAAYAGAIRSGAPQAVQVSDRWHQWANLAKAVEKTLIAHETLVDPFRDHLRRGRADDLRMDLSAAVAGLTLPYSNGPIEGVNTKVKFLKRQMYGRAGFAPLRQRILLA